MVPRTGVLVACLVLTAGCNAIAPGLSGSPAGTTTETLTPAPVTEATTRSSPTPRPERLPPGLFANGTVDTARLRVAHNASLAGTSYTWVYRRDRDDGENVTRRFYRRVSVDGDAVVVRDRFAGFLPNRSLYVDGNESYLLRDGENVTLRGGAGPALGPKYAPGGRLFASFLPERNASVSAVERNGRRLYRIYVPPGGAPLGFRSDAGEAWSVLDYRLTAYVTPAGRLRTVVVDYRRKMASRETFRVTIRFDYTDVGETVVTRPEWVPGSDTPRRSVPTATPVGNGTKRDGRP